MSNNNSAKGNPAGKRMNNTNRRTSRERSWRDGQERTQARRAAQDKRAAANRERRANGEPTPWQLATAKRAARQGVAV